MLIPRQRHTPTPAILPLSVFCLLNIYIHSEREHLGWVAPTAVHSWPWLTFESREVNGVAMTKIAVGRRLT